MTDTKGDNLVIATLAGHKITDKKCIFSSDSKKLLVPCGPDIHVYSSQKGSLIRILKPNFDGKKAADDDIVEISLDPEFPKNRMVAFTTRGYLHVLDYLNGNCIMSLDLYSSSAFSRKVVFGKIFRRVGHESGYGVVYFGNEKQEIFRRDIMMPPEDSVGVEEPETKRQKKQQTRNDDRPVKLNIIHNYEKEDNFRAAFGGRGEFLAVTRGKEMFACNLQTTGMFECFKHMADNKFTCISSHPSEVTVATGNKLGQVFIWRGMTESHFPGKSVHHWHPTPVSDICFTSSGSQFYSVGSEGTLVCWETLSGTRRILPRLGLPIRYVTCDKKNQLIATSHVDNTLQVFKTDLSAYNSWHIEIPEMMRDFTQRSNFTLDFDPQMNCLVSNGRPGHLQFYSVPEKKRVFSLDVVERNFLPSEPDKIIVNVDVDLFCVSPDGSWIATQEARDDGINYPEHRLKFWMKTDKKEKFTLNTTLHYPHQQKFVKNMKFSPDSDLLVTMGGDAMFKLWHQVSDGNTSRIRWESTRNGYRNSVWIPSLASFSSDSSILAVLFDTIVTFWTISDDSVKHEELTLFEGTDFSKKVVGLNFGSGNSSQLLVEVRGPLIRVFSILSLKAIWKYESPEEFTCMSYDSAANVFACFTSSNKLMIFEMISSTPIVSQNISLDKKIIRSVFSSYKQDNRLFMLTSDQQLLALMPPDYDSSPKPEPESKEEKGTPGYIKIAGKNVITSRDVDQLKEQDNRDRLIEKEMSCDQLADEMFVNVPSHVIPPMELLTKSFLTCLLTGVQPKDLRDNLQ